MDLEGLVFWRFGTLEVSEGAFGFVCIYLSLIIA